jgi:phenylalanyl-tRNA synthetase alpha chain
MMTQRGQIHPGTVAAVDPQALETDALAALDTAATSDDVERVRIEYLGRKSPLKLALREVRDRETGMALNTLRERLEKAFDAREKELGRAELDRRLTEERIDITMPGTPVPRGQLHLITQIRREFEDIFLGLGYTVVDGREVETTRYNFDALNFPPAHPTRSPLQTLFLDDETVLRTETSPSQVRVMEAQKPPVYIVSPGRVYRRDTPDATHVPTFHQMEGLAVDEGITLADLLGTLEYLIKQLFGEERRTDFRIHNFPFTEPSVEALVSCHICDGAGCPVCRHSGWIEVGGSGMVDPNVFEFVGYDPEQYTGFAFGWGLERIAVLRHGIPDLRELWRNDPRLQTQF